MAEDHLESRVDAAWEMLKGQVQARHPEVVPGKMMTADALTLGGKVFVFRSRRNGAGLGCKLGGGHDPQTLGITDWKPLQPFKGKAPMRGWFVIGPEAIGRWLDVAEAALAHAHSVREDAA